MAHMLVLLAAASFLHSPIELSHQDQVGAVARARQVLLDAADAMGGLDKVEGIRTVTRTLRFELVDPSQNVTPGTTAPFAYGDLLFRYDYAGNRAWERMASRTTHGDGGVTVYALNGDGGYSANLDGKTFSTIGKEAFPLGNQRRFRRNPEWVLLQALRRPEATRFQGSAKGAHRVTASLPDGSLVTLVFDATSKLLTAVESYYEDPVIGETIIATHFSDYRDVSGVRLPFAHTTAVGDTVLQRTIASSIQLNEPIDASLFSLPEGLSPAKSFLPPTGMKKLGEGVYLDQSPYNALFVEHDDHIVAIEPGGMPNFSKAAIAEIRKLIPGKPIKYVVATHFHHDHLGGVRNYVAEGATVVTTRSARPVIERAVTAKREVRPDTLARSPRKLTIQTVTGRRTLGKVELYELKTPHCEEILIVYVPAEKVLLVADLVDFLVPEGELPGAGADARALLNSITELGLDVRTIVPVHGRMATIEELKQAVAKSG